MSKLIHLTCGDCGGGVSFEMPTCRTCRHWEPPPEPDCYGNCRLTGDCVKPPVSPPANVLMSAFGFHDYGYGLATSPDFGCLHHKDA